ncbi:MAG: hypothetical protein HRF49_10800 [bacterium]
MHKGAGRAHVRALFIFEARPELKSYLSAGLADCPGLELVFPEPAEEGEYLRLAPSAELLVGWRPTEALLEAAARMRLFICPAVGVQHLVEPFRKLAESRGVILANGHGNTYFTAQHAVAMLLALTNRIIPFHNEMAAGVWNRHGDSPASVPMRGIKIGLLGYGAVNRKVHKFLSGFDVEFIVCTRRGSGAERARHHSYTAFDDAPPPAPARWFAADKLHEFLDAVDILVCALPSTSETRGIIGARELALLGPSGLLVNVGRGDVIQEAALYESLRDGKIAGAAIDVWYDYTPKPDARGKTFPASYPFYELKNVVLSPHRAASPLADLRRWDEVIENIRRFAAGRTDLLNIVNLERGY